MSARAIVLGFTTNYAFAAGALLASILARDPAFDATVVIYHDGLPEDQQAAFLRLWPRCRFLPFTAADVAKRLGVTVDDARVAPYLAHFSPLVLTKLELPALLDEYERVIWLDADILVRGPLAPLWDFDCLAWRPLPEGAFARREKVLSVFRHLDLDPAVPLLNGGVIGVSRRFLDRGGSVGLIHRMAAHLVEQAPPSQIAEMPWYLAAASLHLPVTAWPMRFNHPVMTGGVEDALLVHAIGPHKFWNATPLMQLFPDWATHQATWVACGGQPYAGPLTLAEAHPAEAAEVLKAADARTYWLTVFADLRAALPRGMVADLRHDRKFLRLFLHGRPEEQHLRLLRLSNEQRMGLEVHLPRALRAEVLDTLAGAVKGARREGDRALSVPIAQIGQALAAADAVIPDA
ncbi:glycosyltransferase [Pseudogemmobacter blasticus]|uniref:Lipopolysaccharide biosynthesis protein, LPS:glycosyltransferase n=1 Tax=Fuscovulum blasticum DSM 2131 TaxID=1188250 RepID=A0A2T4JFA7_FUSBL|nr:glycosyltransferase [Fuscovulum blasticum]PTE16599.1 hypothetical protein C5F44_01750 [Fuscovulum blasticum DSM 2131]